MKKHDSTRKRRLQRLELAVYGMGLALMVALPTALQLGRSVDTGNTLQPGLISLLALAPARPGPVEGIASGHGS